jgi:hypothetical protein
MMLATACEPEVPRVSQGLSFVPGCKTALERYWAGGLLQAYPLRVRAEVDEALWVSISEIERNGFLEALACFAFDGQPLKGDEYAVIYGYNTGQRLAVITESGTKFDPIKIDERNMLPDLGR